MLSLTRRYLVIVTGIIRRLEFFFTFGVRKEDFYFLKKGTISAAFMVQALSFEYLTC